MIKNKLSETVSVNTEIGNEFEKRINSLKRISRIKECFCKNKNCSSQIINAHSIQNNKILREIAVNGKVISIVPTEVDNQFATKAKKIGRKVATVSTNFCGYHDTEIFLPIESKDYQKNNRQQEFLFAYRALAKEYHAKREMLLFLRNSIYQSSSQKRLDFLSQGLPGIKIALKQLEFEKIYFNKKLQISDFKFLKTYYFEFRGLSGVAASSLISIEKDLLGNTVNNIDDFNEDLRLLFLSVFPQRDKTVLLLSFHKKEQVFKNLIKQIQKMRKIDQQIIFSNILLFYVENFVLSPCLWDSYSIQKQQDIQRVVSEIGEVNSNNLGQIKSINLFS